MSKCRDCGGEAVLGCFRCQHCADIVMVKELGHVLSIIKNVTGEPTGESLNV